MCISLCIYIAAVLCDAADDTCVCNATSEPDPKGFVELYGGVGC